MFFRRKNNKQMNLLYFNLDRDTTGRHKHVDRTHLQDALNQMHIAIDDISRELDMLHSNECGEPSQKKGVCQELIIEHFG